jgi:ABC-2 type transport system permease protein
MGDGQTMNATHFRCEVLRTLRNRRLFAFTLALPLVLFFAVGSANRHALTDGIAFPLYFMTGMAAYGSLFAVISPGVRIALDRSTGWTRQLKITPLRDRTYFVAKALTAYLVAVPTLALLYLAGLSLGVHLDAAQWLEMTGLLLVGLAPFVVMGIIAGHLVRVDSLAPAMGGLVVLFALFGGAFGWFFKKGAMLTVVKLLPSFWLVQSGKAALVHGNWPTEGWIVVAAWTVILVFLAVLAYRRDTGRV